METAIEDTKRKGRHQRAPKKYTFRLEKNDNIDDILVVGAMFPWLETRGFYRALPHRSWRKVQQQLCILHSNGFFTHLTPTIGSDLGLQNKLVPTQQLFDRLISRGLLPAPLVVDPEEKKHNKGGERIQIPHTNMHIYTMASLWGGARDNLVTRRALIGDVPLDIPYNFTFNGKKRESHLRPDDFLRIQRGLVKDYYFFEAQVRSPKSRTDLDKSSSLQKFLAYYNIIHERKFHEHEMGIKKARVLFVYLTEEKMRNAMADLGALNVPGIQKYFYFQVVPWDGKFGNLYTTPWYRVGAPPISLETGLEVV